MSGKVKSLHGVYKALGRGAFLAAAKIYSDHVQKTVEATLSEMESRWFDTGHTITQADKMVRDFVCLGDGMAGVKPSPKQTKWSEIFKTVISRASRRKNCWHRKSCRDNSRQT